MRDLAHLLVVSLVVMGIAHTVAKEKIFEPLRTVLGGHDTFLGYLCSCPYCASHYVAFVVVPITGTYFVPIAVQWGIVTPILRWFLSSILVVVIAAFLRVGFYFVDETQGLVRRRQKVVEAEKQRVDAEVERVEVEVEREKAELERVVHEDTASLQ